MEPDEYRRSLLAAAAVAVEYVAGLLRMLPKRPTPEQWHLFTLNAYPHVMEARRQAFVVSQRYYLDQRQAAGVDPATAPEFIERRYPVDRLEKALEPVRARLILDDDLIDVPEAQRRVAERDAAAIIERHSMAAGRSAIEDAASHDPKALGWARVPSGAETCAFCTMLTSRGPVYKSQKTAKVREDGEPYHNRCDCVPVPVFDRGDWPGRDEYIKAKALWRQHGSLKDLRAFFDAA